MKSRTGVNQHEPDPIQNRVMTDSCWDGLHYQKSQGCEGWLESCEWCECDKKCYQRDKKDPECLCDCHHRKCECTCHDDNPRPARIRRDKSLTMNILESGCGTIEVK